MSSDAPSFTPPATRVRLIDVVPYEAWRPVRWALMASYLVAYLWWLRFRGLPIDRISVAISVGVFLLCAFVGRSWRTWAVLLLDCLLYCVMWISYERTRDYADNGISFFGLFHIDRFPLQVEAMRNIDRALFLGHDPNHLLQDHLWESTVRWYDVVASMTYMTHFVVPVVVMAVLWYASRRQWVRFMKRFATLLLIACALFTLLPTAPPWMAASPKFPYQIMEPLHRDAGRGFYHLGFRGFVAQYAVQLSKGNPVAAMPSLHASFALITPAFFLPWIRRRWLKVLVLCFPVVMLTSLVYLGEHWVIDGLVGWAITGGAFWFWRRREQSQRSERIASARAALVTA